MVGACSEKVFVAILDFGCFAFWRGGVADGLLGG